jgi:hypothetical protein
MQQACRELAVSRKVPEIGPESDRSTVSPDREFAHQGEIPSLLQAAMAAGLISTWEESEAGYRITFQGRRLDLIPARAEKFVLALFHADATARRLATAGWEVPANRPDREPIT